MPDPNAQQPPTRRPRRRIVEVKHVSGDDKIIVIDGSKFQRANKANGGWNVLRPEGKTVHVRAPGGVEFYKRHVTGDALTKADAAVKRLHAQRFA